MAYTLGNIVTRVLSRVRDTAFSTTDTKGFINDAIRDACNEHVFPFMETTQDYTVTVGVSDITNGSGLPTNYVQALDILYTGTGGERVLPYQDIREVDTFEPDADDTTAHPAGSPLYWYKYANTIRVYPAPSTAYTLKLRYYKEPTELSADASVPEIPSEFEEMIILGAAYRIMQVKDNYDIASYLQNKYDEILQKMTKKYSQAQIGAVTTMRSTNYSLDKMHF